MSLPTSNPNPNQQWAGHIWHPSHQRLNSTRGGPPPLRGPPTNFLHAGRNQLAMPPRDHPTSPEPPLHWNDPPLLRNMAGTYGLASTVHHLHPTRPSQPQYEYRTDLVPRWTVPVPQAPPVDPRYHRLDHPISPLPHGQWVASPTSHEDDLEP
ncbi:hypothetical protein ARMSODRAFT_1012831 [Armillaria solidipes]|uniref:Uncharacterized protein n=1 Tax=Armillaria solidipes TaxID=1076256 RepID=A0A2H3CAL8_9AGAR|nr:hypothetical protein ARMSODRAFT_1012831 [Armillaria solidipes]